MNQLPRIKLAQLPTPIEPLTRLSAELGGINLWIKRDDQTGLAFGGNKTRKLEFLMAEAQANGARTVITAGAVQSNHCRQTAAAAAFLGLDCVLVLAGDHPAQPGGNLLLDHLLGAQVIYTPGSQRDVTLQQEFERLWSDGRRPYLVPYGGSSPVGAAAYAFALQELLEQGFQADWIVFASSSGGTQAGLEAGARLLGFQGRLLGISIDEPAGILQARVASLARETADRLGRRVVIPQAEILVNDSYLGGGYGVLNASEAAAIRLFARRTGILLDPVYTGRAASGLLDLARQQFFNPGETVLFWHTGGGPALFVERYLELLTGQEQT